MSVPKIIHYCWFGGRPLSAQAKKTLQTWRRYAPEYELHCWSEVNFDINACSFVKGAYTAGKWAFVSDYVRFKVLFELGGVYMDVGSELIRGFEDLVIGHAPFVGIEYGSWTANSGLIAVCEPGDELIGEVLAKYESIDFEDSDEFCGSHTVNDMLTNILIDHGFVRDGSFQRVCGWSFLPAEYFDPKYGFLGYSITENTRSLHKGSASWGSPAIKKKRLIEHKLTPLVGRRAAQVFGRIAGELSCNGLVDGLKNLTLVFFGVLGCGRNAECKSLTSCDRQERNGDEE